MAEAVVTVRDMLEYARKRVANGWTQGMLGDWTKGSGSVCALGAIFAARYNLDGMTPEEVEMESNQPGTLVYETQAAVSDCIPEEDWSIVEFNDSEDVRLEDVLRVFDCALEGME